MATEPSQLLLPAGAVDDVTRALQARFELSADTPLTVERTFWDTFDGRLHGEGLALEAGDGGLALVDLATAAQLAVLERAPRGRRVLLVDLPAGALRDALAPVIEMRAVTPVARVRSRVVALRVLNDDLKTVVRLAAEEPAAVPDAGDPIALAARLHVSPVRGYDGALSRVLEALDGLGLAAVSQTLQDEAMTALGAIPGGVSSKLSLKLKAAERADAAAAVVAVRLLDTIEFNLPGTLADTDTEFLHDLRVAVRRTRALQRELKGVFEPEALRHYRAEFRELQQLTGPTRDLDVQLLEVDELTAALAPDAVGDIAPLTALLARRRAGAQRRMARLLRGERTSEVLSGWRGLLDGLVEAPTDERPDATRAIGEVAAERIAKVYRQMVKMGSAIDDETAPEALHELRKKGKELRYLLEFFASLFAADVIKPMVASLKSLQDVLGRFQDRDVQISLLRSLGDDVAALEGGPLALMAMGVAIEHLRADQDRARAEFAERFAAFATKDQRALVRATFG